MININLLPWREEKRLKKKKKFKKIITLELIAAILIVFINLFLLPSNASNYKQQHQLLLTELAKIQGEISALAPVTSRKEQLTEKITALQKLESNQYKALNTLKMLQTTVPKTIQLTELVFNETEGLIKGRSPDNKTITLFGNKIKNYGGYYNIKIKGSRISVIDNVRSIEFQITYNYLSPAEREENEKTNT